MLLLSLRNAVTGGYYFPCSADKKLYLKTSIKRELDNRMCVLIFWFCLSRLSRELGETAGSAGIKVHIEYGL